MKEVNAEYMIQKFCGLGTEDKKFMVGYHGAVHAVKEAIKITKSDLSLTNRATDIYTANRAKGFHEQQQHPAVYLMLIVSELAEALEADRKGKYTNPDAAAWMHACCDDGHKYEEHFPQHIKDTHEDEIADALIRILDYCGNFGIDIESHVRWKLEYNKTREHKHGKKY